MLWIPPFHFSTCPLSMWPLQHLAVLLTSVTPCSTATWQLPLSVVAPSHSVAKDRCGPRVSSSKLLYVSHTPIVTSARHNSNELHQTETRLSAGTCSSLLSSKLTAPSEQATSTTSHPAHLFPSMCFSLGFSPLTLACILSPHFSSAPLSFTRLHNSSPMTLSSSRLLYLRPLQLLTYLVQLSPNWFLP